MEIRGGRQTFFAVGAIFIVGLGGWVLGFATSTGFWTEITAAWIQAVGSLAALLWGFWLFDRSSREAARAEARHKMRVGASIISIVKMARANLSAVHTLSSDARTKDSLFSELTFDRLALVDEALAKLPYLDVAGGELAFVVLTTRTRISQARRRAEEYNACLRGENVADSGVTGAPLEPDEKVLQDLRRQFRRLADLVGKDVNRLQSYFPGIEKLIPIDF